MKFTKSFKYRIFPNQEQKKLINKTFGCTRFTYNYFLNQRNELYRNLNESTTYVKQAKELTVLKKELVWLKEIDSTSLQSALKNLDIAFKKFFQKKANYPKFKSKKNSKNSYTSKNSYNAIRIEEDKLKFPKLKLIKIKLHRKIPKECKILSGTITKTSTNNYFVSINTEYEKEIIEIPCKNNIVGLDFSMKELFVSSDNQRADYPRFYRKSEKKLAKAQKKLSRMKKFSNNWYKQKLKVSKIHSKIQNSRTDFLHKLSTNLVDKYNAISIENLNMKEMSQVLNFGKSVADNGWGIFTMMLKYKTELAGKQLVKIDKFYPSSKTCSICGKIKKDLKLSDRTYICECGFSIDRDLNASINIKNQGKLLLKY